MDQLVESDYTIVYLHHGISKENKPKLGWLKKMHASFDRRYKKNLKALYIVHASMFVKVVMKVCACVREQRECVHACAHGNHNYWHTRAHT
jgi:hypothetical protein